MRQERIMRTRGFGACPQRTGSRRYVEASDDCSVQPITRLERILEIGDKRIWYRRDRGRLSSFFGRPGIQEYMFCPYCDCRAPAAAFTTENQRAFLDRQRELWNMPF